MKWKIAKKKYDDIMLQILFNRGILGERYDSKSVERFLNPDFEKDFHNPELLPSYKKIENKIREAIEHDMKIGIFADYDADGIPGSALLHKMLEVLNIRSEIYIPNRESGYGLSTEGIDYLLQRDCSIIITVDLGIRNVEEANYAKLKDICLIITDHHEPGDNLPDVYAIMNPKIKGSKYPFRELSGAGVIFKLIQGLSKKYPQKISESFVKWNMDLVAISTISDVVPLVDENRIIARFGLMVLKKTKNVGLLELYKVANIDKEKINSYSIGFQIGPRINAPGRLDHATKSFMLLVTKDKKEAAELAFSLNQTNEKRQEEMAALEKKVAERIEKENLLKNNTLVVLGDWHKGVLGPSASHLVEKFSRPAIIFSDRSDPYVGSARSVSGVNLIVLLEKCSSKIERFGGHKGAAGLAVKKSKFQKFYEEFIQLCNNLDKKLFEKVAKVDTLINFASLSLSLTSRLKQLEPFGMGNPRPVFELNNVKISDIRCVGKNNTHQSFRIVSGEKKIKSIFFNCNQKFSENKRYDMIFTLDEDFWNGKNYVSANIIDMRENGQKE
ncbi:MAG: single-stranded-DNA-specific exonuclease RecJ [Patescibacteria group bacterium]|jgi:single-stranded-DNA-specific exonuclease